MYFCNKFKKYGVMLLLLIGVTAASAQQLATASIAGVLRDSAGKAISGASVLLENPAQGTKFTVTTQADGRFSYVSLEATHYLLLVPATQGFEAWRKDVPLAVGQSALINILLRPEGVKTTVEVNTADSDMIDSGSSVVGGVIGAKEIESMPLNGRNYLELSYLVPGNAPAPNFDPTKVNSQVVSTAGQAGRGGNVTIDGADNNDDVVGGPLVNIPEDAVQEFQIASNHYTAAIGRSGSAVINVVTRQGSNALHGSLGMYERDHILQGEPATYDPSIGTRTPFHRQQYDGSIGGPIRKDRAWWFTALEDRQQIGATLVGTRDLTNKKISRSFVAAPLHDFMSTERVDWQVRAQDRIGFRESLELEDALSQSKLNRSLGSAAYRENAQNHLQSLMMDWVHIFTPSLVNRVSFADNNFVNDTKASTSAPQITFPDLDDGASYRVPQQTKQFRLQGDDVLTWTKSRHSISLGGEIQAIDADFNLGVFQQGNIQTVEDFPDFDRNQDGTVDDDDLLFAVALRSSTPTRALVIPNNDSYHLALFLEDDMRVTPRLSLNLGLRWEADTNLNNLSWYSERNPLVQSFYSGSRHHDWSDWGPRVGFNYMIDPRLSLHGGYGMYYDRIILEVMSMEKGFDGRALALDVSAGNVVSSDGSYVYLNSDGTFVSGAPTVKSNPFGGFIYTGAGSTGIDIINNRLRSPMVQHFNLGLETQIARGLSIRLDGVHDLGTRFIIGRPVGEIYNPVIEGEDEVIDLESAVGTKYDALWATARWQFARLGEFHAAYTFGRAWNYANDDQIPFEYTPVDPTNLRGEYGPPPNDQRHRLVLSGVANLPLKMHFAPMWTIASGVPMDILLPDGSERVPTLSRNAGGRRFTKASQLNDWIDQTNAAGGVYESSTGAYVTLPNVTSNARFNDSFNALDFRLDRTFRLGERMHVDLIGEAFNIFNVTNILGTSNLNYSGFANTLAADSDNSSLSSSFGKPVSTAGGVFGSGGPRAFQFAAKISF